jgi:ATP phosphoribosyltransferase regulatory subunit
LQRLDLPDPAKNIILSLEEVVRLIKSAGCDFNLSVDPVEHRGFEYHEGISFIVFSKSVRGELGRGGRYRSSGRTNDQAGEPSTGFSLFMDTVLQAVPDREESRRVFLPFGESAQTGRQLRAAGWTTIAGLTEKADVRAEARRMKCSHIWLDGKVTEGA